jgi:hypothetical protein
MRISVDLEENEDSKPMSSRLKNNDLKAFNQSENQ